MKQDELLTMKEVASVLGVSRGRAYELVRRGVLPHVRLLRQLRVAPWQLEQFIRNGGCSLDQHEEKAAQSPAGTGRPLPNPVITP